MIKYIRVLLRDLTHRQRYDKIVSFVGEDRSGNFGILPDHDRFMTALTIGLCRFRSDQQDWLYAATAGALLYFHDNRLELTTRHFIVDNDYERISAILAEQLLEEEAQLRAQKQSLRQMEEHVLKRLWELRRGRVQHGYDEI